MQGFWQAVLAAGGIGQLARRIGVANSTPSNWIWRGRVPAEHCPAIERETGVRCEVIRPDVPWGVLRRHDCPASAKAKKK
ncbi:YdaS family helix-turn-helix protein [Variovorax sp. ZT4R33]|uniref:YdaS family helix-turn-helix protein n=1 Tax=Variovorax sp. ZT4R33 TaxID=3443743 RepID=UPI003F466D6C